MENTCQHVSEVHHDVEPHTRGGCEDCLRTGGRWVQLRLCMTCGHVGCCDDSPGKHASAHYAEMHHPIVRSFQSPDDWGWCYVDKQYLDADRL